MKCGRFTIMLSFASRCTTSAWCLLNHFQRFSTLHKPSLSTYHLASSINIYGAKKLFLEFGKVYRNRICYAIALLDSSEHSLFRMMFVSTWSNNFIIVQRSYCTTVDRSWKHESHFVTLFHLCMSCAECARCRRSEKLVVLLLFHCFIFSKILWHRDKLSPQQ